MTPVSESDRSAARDIDNRLQDWGKKERERMECYKADPAAWIGNWYPGRDALYQGILNMKDLQEKPLNMSVLFNHRDLYAYARIVKDAAEKGGKKVVSHLISHPHQAKNNFTAIIRVPFFVNGRDISLSGDHFLAYGMSMPVYMLIDSVDTAILLHDYGRDSGTDRYHGSNNLDKIEGTLNTVYPRQPDRVKAIKKAVEWHDHRIPDSEGSVEKLIHHFLYLADKSDICGARGLTSVFEEDKFGSEELKEWPVFMKRMEMLNSIPYFRDANLDALHLWHKMPDYMKEKQQISMDIYKLCIEKKGDRELEDKSKKIVLSSLLLEMGVMGNLAEKLNGALRDTRVKDVVDAGLYEGILGKAQTISWNKEWAKFPDVKMAKHVLGKDGDNLTLNIGSLLDLRLEKCAGWHSQRDLGDALDSSGSQAQAEAERYFRHLWKPSKDASSGSVFDGVTRIPNGGLGKEETYYYFKLKDEPQSIQELVLGILPHMEMTTRVEEANAGIAPAHGC